MTPYRRLLRIWETDYGRDSGWLIEREGQTIAMLSDARWDDLFWHSYHLEVVTDDPKLRQRILNREFWTNAKREGLVWRSTEFGEAVEGAYSAGCPFAEPGRLLMRGLHIAVRSPNSLDRITLWWRRRTRAHS